MLEAYGVWGKKKFMGREYMGITRASYIIDENGIIERVYEKVKTMSHAKDILNDLG
jgi:peroxiredoxin Q/BCP|tara:strand:- start:539 stop:706 length:168 start_codon:yes stop_codon:yes gene_type:complete